MRSFKRFLASSLVLIASVMSLPAMATEPYVNVTSCQVSQGNQTCDVQLNWYGPSSESEPPNGPSNEPDRVIRTPPCLYKGMTKIQCTEFGSKTYSLSAGEDTFRLMTGGANTSMLLADATVNISYGAYTKPFNWSASTHNEIVGDFNDDGVNDIIVQPLTKGDNTGLFPQELNAYFDSSIHKNWTGSHPQIASIDDWSAENYAGFSGNFNSNPGDELLLLGQRNIILLHGDIITPITIFPTVNNAIVSWAANGAATHTAFSFDANPEDYVVLTGDLSGDGYDEIFLQAKSKGSTSYILSNTGALVQTINNGYLNMEWSAASYIASISGGQIHFTAKSSADDNNVANTNSSGAVSSLMTAITKPTISGSSNKYVFEGLYYHFEPSVNTSASSLTFTAIGMPSWMTLNSNTGVLSGTPGENDTRKSHTITLTVNENKSHTVPTSMTIKIEVAETYKIGQVNYSIYKTADGTLYLLDVETEEVIKIVDDNGAIVALLSSLAEYNESGATLLSGYNIKFEDVNFDGHIDMVLEPIDGSGLELIVISYIEADVHEVIVGDAPMRDELDHGPTTLPAPATNPLVGSDPSTVVGSLPADFSVKPSGAAVYDVPITVAPGSGGMVPNISIAYDSLSDNGIMGVGWNIKGLSVISTCQTNREQDGVTTPSKFGEGRLCLNGKKLYQDSTDGAYRTEDRTTLNIVKDSEQQFTEYHVDGSRTIYYQFYTDHLLFKKIDASGNYIEMVYEKSNGEAPLLKKVLYTGNEKTGQQPFNAIEFEYEDRDDNIYRYGARTGANINKRISHINSWVNTNSVGSNGNQLRTYALRYDYAEISNRSLLKGIKACRNAVCLPETTFDWEQGSLEYASEYAFDLGSRYNNSATGRPWKYLFLDFDGDGVLDYWKNKDDDSTVSSDTTDDLLIVKGGDTFEEIDNRGNYLNSDLRFSIKVIDYNSDGKDDLIFHKDGNWQLLLAKSGIAGGSYHDFDNLIDTGIPYEVNIIDADGSRGGVKNESIYVADHDGDGYPDFTYIHDNKIWIRYNLNVDLSTTPSSSLFSAPVEFVIMGLTRFDSTGDFDGIEDDYDRIQREKKLVYFFKKFAQLFIPIDTNGDGVVEYQVAVPTWTDDYSVSASGQWRLFEKGRYDNSSFLGNWNDAMDDFNKEYDRYDLQLVDLNSDGRKDEFYVKGVWDSASQTSKMTGYFSVKNAGSGSIALEEYGDGGDDYHKLGFRFADYNSDGYLDLIHGSEHNDNTYIHYFNGVEFSEAKILPLIISDFPIKFFTDINGDGLVDYAYFNGAMKHQLSTSKKRDMINVINDGSKLRRTIEYSTDVHIKDDDAAGKNWGNGSLVTDVGAAIHLVSTTKKMPADQTSCGTSTCYEWFNFQYKGLKAQLGRGLLGYREFKIVDYIKNKTVDTEYRQDFPFTGMLKSRSVMIGNIGERKTVTTDVLYTKNTFGLAYPFSTTTKSYENNLQLSEKTVENFVVDQFGQPETVYTVIREPNKSASFTSTEVFTYELQEDHYGGRLTNKTTSISKAGTSATNVVDFEYFSDSGLLWKKITDPSGNIGSSNAIETGQIYGVTEEYERDGFGNVISVLIKGSDLLERKTEVKFDTKGRYATESTVYPDYPITAVSFKSYTDYHLIFGAKISETSANDQTTHYGYNTLGRLNFESSPDGTYKTTQKVLCSESLDCLEDAYYKEDINASHGPNSVIYFDALGNKVAEKSETLTCFNSDSISGVCSGEQVQWVIKKYFYNNKGQKIVESRPHFEGGLANIVINEGDDDELPVWPPEDCSGDCEIPSSPGVSGASSTLIPTGYASFEYDSQGRLTVQYKFDRTRWVNSYNGLTTTISNPSLNTTSKKTNILGELIQMTDADEQVVNYEYDALGSLSLVRRQHSSISGGSGNIDTVIVSDHLGRKLSMTDPDKGTVNYKYNSFGELVWQSDNKGQQSFIYYDSLGRKTESLAYSDYDNKILDQHIKSYYDEGDYALGVLSKEEDLVNGITKETSFNVMSQPIRDITSFANGRTFANDIVYNDLFRVAETYDASNVNAGIEYSYFDNYLVSKTDKISSTLLWKFLQADALGNTSVYKNGNGVVNFNLYDQTDGTYESILSVKNNNDLQNVVYNFNALGNLEYRDDGVVGMRETFNYDIINRLDDWTVTYGTDSKLFNIDYDHLGNIISKTGMGTYQYGGTQCGTAGPHAVTKVGSDEYCYDANGNMISGGGRTTTSYNSSDKPIFIKTEKNHRVSYYYGLGGSRFKRVDTSSDSKVKETLYIGNVEFISEEGKLTKVLRHMEGVALETYLPATGNRSLEFLHRDHLGSVALITDINGNAVKKFSYDPWGQRRDETSYLQVGFPAVDSALGFAVTDFRRGYTGHEHIDEAGLIHMGGRVYDPRLGRFLSADPFVKTTENLQSFNRYTYVSNNPLNATDPSGYFEMSLSFSTSFGSTYANNFGSSVWEFEARNNYQMTNSHNALKNAYNSNVGHNAVAWSSFGNQKKQGNGKSLFAWEDNGGLGDFDSPQARVRHMNKLSNNASAFKGQWWEGTGGFAEGFYTLAGNTLGAARSWLPFTSDTPTNIYTDAILSKGQYNRGAQEFILLFVPVGMASKANYLGRLSYVSNSAVWKLKPTVRGNAIEAALAKTDYKDWFNVGKLNRGYFPLVDFQKGNTLVSLKSVDTTGSTWMGRMSSHIDDLATRGATVDGQKANMVLDIRVQAGGAKDAASLIQYGRQQGANVVIKEF